MSIEVSIGSEGMDEAEALIAQLGKISGKVSLFSDSRIESSKTNDEVLEHLRDLGRDYTSQSSSEKEAIAKGYIKAFDGELQKVMDSGRPMTDKDRKSVEEAALKAAMKIRMEQVAEKVKAGGSVRTGQLLRNLQNTRNIRVK